ncbi:DUF6461 domain-containing protein [Williamsia muralis]|uniref:DUF6461 domain-containing protein n=1 Tax=Williamsia marianensis TaxID=85044 RepID=UPI003F5CC481
MYENYAWTSRATDLFNGFSLTYVRDATVAGVIDSLPTVGDEVRSADFRTLAEGSSRLREEVGGERQYVGLFQVNEWSVMYESNGYVGATPSISGPLSLGREVISHHRNISNALETFHRFVDGELRTHFQPKFPDMRYGTSPDELLPMMHEIGGFNLTDADTFTANDTMAATFALCDALSGLQLSPALLRNSRYEIAEVVL